MQRKNDFSFEIGVLMFNVFDGINKENYDSETNLTSIIGIASELLQIDSLENGFVGEAVSHGVDINDAEVLFLSARAKYNF